MNILNKHKYKKKSKALNLRNRSMESRKKGFYTSMLHRRLSPEALVLIYEDTVLEDTLLSK